MEYGLPSHRNLVLKCKLIGSWAPQVKKKRGGEATRKTIGPQILEYTVQKSAAFGDGGRVALGVECPFFKYMHPPDLKRRRLGVWHNYFFYSPPTPPKNLICNIYFWNSSKRLFLASLGQLEKQRSLITLGPPSPTQCFSPAGRPPINKMLAAPAFCTP